MKFKKLFFLPLVAFAVVGCTTETPDDPETPSDPTTPTDPEPTTPTDPTDPEPTTPTEPTKTVYTLEEVQEVLKEFDMTSVNEYTYTYRNRNGTAIDNGEVVNFKLYEDGFDGTTTVYSDFPTTSSLTGNTSKTGRYASYTLNSDYYVVGVYGISDDYDGLEYYERNYYVDHDDGLEYLDDLYTDLYAAFVDTSSYWNESLGFVIDETITNTVNESGNVEVSFGATAEEVKDDEGETVYKAETSKVVLELNPTDSTVVSMTVEFVIYDFDKSWLNSTVDEGASTYGYYRVDNFSFGDRYTGEIEPFVVSNFSEDRIINAPTAVVEGIEEGDIGITTVQQIITNIDAYVVGCVSSEVTEYLTSYTHPTYSTNVGATVSVTTNKRYEGYILESTTVYTPVDNQYEPYTTSTKYESTDEGVVVSGSTEQLIPADSITKMSTYFSASPAFSDNIYFAQAFSHVKNYGLEANGTQGSGNYEALSDTSFTKNGNTISIKFTYTYGIYYPPYYSNESIYKFEMTIVDDFMTSFKYEVDTGTYIYYTMTGGEFPTYPTV